MASAPAPGILFFSVLRGRRNGRLQYNALPFPHGGSITGFFIPMTELGLGSGPALAFTEATMYDIGDQTGLVSMISVFRLLAWLDLGRCQFLAISEGNDLIEERRDAFANL